MSNLVPTQPREFTPAQVDLIRRTIAPTATPQEFELFIYRCKHMDLDPLKPGEIYFIKYGNSPGTIVVGIEGFRKRAERTGKRSGIKRGSIRDADGKLVGAWCEVFRSDWKEPAREEVSLNEYNTNKAQWAKMPETMIKKVAECAALRMAFPDELGGLYGEEEMHQAERDVAPKDLATDGIPASLVSSPGDHVITFGTKYPGQSIKAAVESDGTPEFERWLNILKDNAQKKGWDRPPADHQIVIDKYALFKKSLVPSIAEELSAHDAEEDARVEAAINEMRMGNSVYSPETARELRMRGLK